jgi:hypothetical protein
MERRIIAVGAAVAAALTTAGAGLVGAGATQGLEWAIPAGTVLGVFGASLGSALGVYRMTSREPVIGVSH